MRAKKKGTARSGDPPDSGPFEKRPTQQSSQPDRGKWVDLLRSLMLFVDFIDRHWDSFRDFFDKD